jgi:glyoxylase-like metal-dependent hydrolase (beta-lactamase superfamily II)
MFLTVSALASGLPRLLLGALFLVCTWENAVNESRTRPIGYIGAFHLNTVMSQQLDFGITCIDAAYISPGLACFYLLEQDGECAIIETGTSHSLVNLERVMAERGIAAAQVRYVIPTHVHLDHAGGAGAMMARFHNATLLIHPKGARHMINPQRLVESSQEVYGEKRFAELYGEIVAVDAGRVREMADGDCVELAGRSLEFRHTRGHADHHFCVWDAASHGWFSGDMFGISYPWFRFEHGDFLLPATTPTQFNPELYLASLALLHDYGPQRIYLTHHGELTYSEDKARLLAGQVTAYRDLAPAYAGDKPALERALSDYSLEQLRPFDSRLPEKEQRQLLAFDMDLNAQGLQVWLQRST